MRKLVLFAAAMAVALVFAVPAFAGHNEGCPPHNPNCNQPGGDTGGSTGGNGYGGSSSANAGALGLGVGVGVGIGKGGSATAFGGKVMNSGNSASKSGVYGSGNSNVDVTSVLKNTNMNSNHNQNVAKVGDITNTMGQDQGQTQGQRMGQGQALVDNSDLDFTVEGDDIVYEAPDIPVNSAAPVFAGACSQGISAQGMGFGGSAASGNPVCDYVAVAGGLIGAGSRDEAMRVLGKAEGAADWRYRISQIRNILTLGLL